jgi:hypothetical protein
MPTGSDDLDMDIVVAACRNGCADLCVVYAMNPVAIHLGLEVSARTGVDVQLRPAVADRCVQCLGGGDVELAGAAFKCLLAMGQPERVQYDRLEEMARSDNRTASDCAFLAVVAMALGDRFPPAEVFDRMMDAVEDDKRAEVAVVAGCRDVALATRFVGRLERRQGTIGEIAVKGIVCAARHQGLRKRILALVQKAQAADQVRAVLDRVARELARG